jgi:hypothetical protein
VTALPLFPENYQCACGGLGYIPEDGTGWADPCETCNPDGLREYRPELCEDFLLETNH